MSPLRVGYFSVPKTKYISLPGPRQRFLLLKLSQVKLNFSEWKIVLDNINSRSGQLNPSAAQRSWHCEAQLSWYSASASHPKKVFPNELAGDEVMDKCCSPMTVITRIFWLRFKILYYFIVCYAKILRFWNQIFFYWTFMGGATIVPRSLKTKRNQTNFHDRPIFYFIF